MCSRYRLDVSKLTARDTSVNDALTLLFLRLARQQGCEMSPLSRTPLKAWLIHPKRTDDYELVERTLYQYMDRFMFSMVPPPLFIQPHRRIRSVARRSLHGSREHDEMR